VNGKKTVSVWLWSNPEIVVREPKVSAPFKTYDDGYRDGFRDGFAEAKKGNNND